MDDREKIMKACANKFSQLENQSPNIAEINRQLNLLEKSYTAFENKKKKLSKYIKAVNTINTHQKKIKEMQETKLNYWETRSSRRAWYNEVFTQEQRKEINKNLQIVNKFNEEILPTAKQAYSRIMALRELLTNQTIVYAVSSKKDTRIWQGVIKEKDYLSLIEPKAITFEDTLEEINKKTTYKNAGMVVGNKQIKEFFAKDAKPVKSRDKLYQLISKYIVNDNKGTKIKNWEAWEAYNEAKSSGVKEENFEDFMGAYLNRTHSKILKIGLDKSEELTLENKSFSTLAFYRGGDIAGSNKYTMIQAKAVSGDWQGANININSIYNAVVYIHKIFHNKAQVDVKDVLNLFTATYSDGLSSLPNNIYNAAFNEANDYAQEQIKKAIQAFNK